MFELNALDRLTLSPPPWLQRQKRTPEDTSTIACLARPMSSMVPLPLSLDSIEDSIVAACDVDSGTTRDTEKNLQDSSSRMATPTLLTAASLSSMATLSGERGPAANKAGTTIDLKVKIDDLPATRTQFNLPSISSNPSASTSTYQLATLIPSYPVRRSLAVSQRTAGDLTNNHHLDVALFSRATRPLKRMQLLLVYLTKRLGTVRVAFSKYFREPVPILLGRQPIAPNSIISTTLVNNLSSPIHMISLDIFAI